MTIETQPEPTALQLEEAISMCLENGLKFENLGPGPVPNPQRELGRIAASLRSWWEDNEPRLEAVIAALDGKVRPVPSTVLEAMSEGDIAQTLDFWLWTKVQEIVEVQVAALLDALEDARHKTQADLDAEWQRTSEKA